MVDCLLLGHYEISFQRFVDMARGMGAQSGAFRDVSLSFVEVDGRPLHALGLLNHIRSEATPSTTAQPFHNADFLWPAMTYLGTYLLRRGFSFEFVNLPHLEIDKLTSLLRGNDIHVIAITTTLHVSPVPILELINTVRSLNATAKIVVGGPFIDTLTKVTHSDALSALLQYMGADVYVASSEGEKALTDIISCVKSGTSLQSVDNIYYREGREFVFTRAVTESNSLSENMTAYEVFRECFNEFVTVRTAKSCPFRCAFCALPQRAGQYVYLKVEEVERELNAIRAIGGVTTLTFIDDTFNVPKERFRELMRMMIKNQYGFKWNSFFRSDHGDEATMELMAEAGCEGVFLGMESGSHEQLYRMNKTSKRKDYLRAIRTFANLGVRTHASLVVGFPGETDDTCHETMDFIAESKPDTFRAQLWYADPTTPIWNKRGEYNIRGSAFMWEHQTMDARHACEWVERMHREIDASVWLPQNGFEQWSTFYLQRKGMSFADILSYLRVFRDMKRSELTTGIPTDLKQHANRLDAFSQVN